MSLAGQEGSLVLIKLSILQFIRTRQYIHKLEEMVAFSDLILRCSFRCKSQFYQGEKIKLNSLRWILRDSFISKRWEDLNKLMLGNVMRIIHTGMAGSGDAWIVL